MRHLLCTHDEADLQVIADVKRLRERFLGDAEFRGIVRESPVRRRDRLQSCGIHIDCATWDPLWQHLESGGRVTDLSALTAYPALRLWMRWRREVAGVLSHFPDNCVPTDARFVSWRRRRIRRFLGELSPKGLAFYPAFAYELSRGCSVGCWFCGLSAGKLEGVFACSRENRALWRGILAAGVAFAGAGANAAFCYHGTEPFDNPHYLAFLEDFHDVCGGYPQTTTAVPLRDLPLTRDLLAARERFPVVYDRFSVLSLAALRKVHQAFSPREMLLVELVLHNRESLTPLTRSGQAREESGKLEDANMPIAGVVPGYAAQDPGTIECLCGYLVNMVDRSVQLVSPCRATDRWPKGYA